MGHLVTLFSSKRILVYDSFNRADNATTLGNADTGQAWTALAGTFGISGNQAYVASHVGADRAVLNANAFDYALTVQFSIAAALQRLIFRNSDINNEWFVEGGASAYTLVKRVAGTTTTQGTYNVGVQSNDQLLVVCRGSVITLYVNGISAITVTDSFNASATNVGIGKSTVTACTWENLVVEAM